MLLDLTYWGNPILRKKCRPIEKVTDEMKKLIQDMIETMDANNGAGLAAPQINKDIRIFVIRNMEHSPDGELILGDAQAFINPKLSNPSEEHDTMGEGCLSVPGLFINVTRPLSITIEALDENGNSFKETVTGFKARQIMHENDHLNGKLHLDRISKNERNKIAPELDRIKKKYSSR